MLLSVVFECRQLSAEGPGFEAFPAAGPSGLLFVDSAVEVPDWPDIGASREHSSGVDVRKLFFLRH